jgi:pyridoxamine 5'-phosphate oxidase
VATVDGTGRPSRRIVLLNGIHDGGFVFYTNYESRKGRELAANPRAALAILWRPQQRQVRVEGTVQPVTPAEADAYFASRERGSQIGAWASTQSREKATEGALEARYAEYESRFRGQDVPRPPYWSGFRVVPDRIEFWHGMPSRLHERELYVGEGDGWRVRPLFP